MAVARRGLTLEQFLQLPEEEPALEYIDGVVSQKASPKLRHSVLQGELAARINAVARRPRVALALPEVRATFAGASVVPDVSVYRWERIPRDAEGEVLDDVFIPPDIAVEIASPRQSKSSLARRCRWYVSNGVDIALLIDPDGRAVLAFRAEDTAEWNGSGHIDISAVIPGFALTVEQLFESLQVG